MLLHSAASSYLSCAGANLFVRETLGSGRLKLISRQSKKSEQGGIVCHEILQDAQTGVQYLMTTATNGWNYNINVSVTPLLDRDGNPFVGEEISHNL